VEQGTQQVLGMLRHLRDHESSVGVMLKMCSISAGKMGRLSSRQSAVAIVLRSTVGASFHQRDANVIENKCRIVDNDEGGAGIRHGLFLQSRFFEQ
jgi:hypothetical protein